MGKKTSEKKLLALFKKIMFCEIENIENRNDIVAAVLRIRPTLKARTCMPQFNSLQTTAGYN